MVAISWQATSWLASRPGASGRPASELADHAPVLVQTKDRAWRLGSGAPLALLRDRGEDPRVFAEVGASSSALR